MTLPAGWRSAHISEVADLKLGKMLDQVKNKGKLRPYLRNVNVRWGHFDLGDLAQMRVTDEEAEQLSVCDGDLFICEGGEPGRAAVWRGATSNLVFQKALHRVRPHALIDPDFIAAYLGFSARHGLLADFLTGTTIKHLPQDALSRITFPLAPANEQRRIVAKLDTLTARVAQARAELERVSRLAYSLRVNVLQSTFDLDRMRLEGTTITKVGEVAEITSGYGFPKHLQGKKEGRFPFAKVSDISQAVLKYQGNLHSTVNYVDDTDLKELRAKPVPAGSTVFAKIGEALRLNRRALTQKDLILDNNCMALTPCLALEPGYLYRFMQTVDLSPFAVATAVPSVRRGDVAALLLPLPSRDAQLEQLGKVEAAFSRADRLEAEAARAAMLLDRLEASLLAKAFRGELVPQDSSDEPASALLDRIRAERAAAPKAKRGRRATAISP